MAKSLTQKDSWAMICGQNIDFTVDNQKNLTISNEEICICKQIECDKYD